jgi:hypothetical protein
MITILILVATIGEFYDINKNMGDEYIIVLSLTYAVTLIHYMLRRKNHGKDDLD